MTRTGLSRSPGSSDGVPSFDTTTQKLFTTPYNTGCANYADRFIEISASGIILLIVLAAFGYAACCLRKKLSKNKLNKRTY